MKNKLKVIVSHPGKQYVHQLLYALQQEGYLDLFITSIWYKPSLLIYRCIEKLPVIGAKLTEKFLRKKQYPHQQDAKIEQFPWPEFRRQLLVQLSVKFRTEKYVFKVEKKHDAYVARRLRSLKPDVLIGYEKSSLESFKVVKRQGGITVLDLAQVHWKYLENLRINNATFSVLFEDKVLFDEINRIKGEEYLYADYILTLSEFAKKTLTDEGINPGKIRVMNLGYNPAIFKPKSSYSKENGLKLIYTGTFTKRKGVEVLLKAMSELAIPELKLTIVGPILDGEELLQEFKGSFHYHDFLPHEQMVKMLQESDVYVFPSLLDSWAMTVVEAMACGLPVIVTETTGSKDIVSNGESGFIIPPDNLSVLKEKILYFYENKMETERMGLKASADAAGYNWSNYYQQIQSFMYELKGEIK